MKLSIWIHNVCSFSKPQNFHPQTLSSFKVANDKNLSTNHEPSCKQPSHSSKQFVRFDGTQTSVNYQTYARNNMQTQRKEDICEEHIKSSNEKSLFLVFVKCCRHFSYYLWLGCALPVWHWFVKCLYLDIPIKMSWLGHLAVVVC